MTSTTPKIKRPILQVDLVNNTILTAPIDQVDINVDAAMTRTKFSDELKAKFYEQIDSFWHTDEDLLLFFAYNSDDTFYAQRNRQKYDFASESSYWNEYQFKGGTVEQAKAVYNTALALFIAAAGVKTAATLKKLDGVEKEYSFFDAKWLKRLREKRMMLSASDWHVLPDVEDSYEGEKQRWMDWRAKVRAIGIPNPKDFPSPLDFAKSLYQQVFPIDPKNYLKLYPDGKLEDGVTDAPAFMDADDASQWTNYDDDASSDFLDSRMLSQLIYARSRVTSTKLIKKEILDIIKEMKVTEIYPDFDYELFKEEEEED
jgi:hypothetical protein